MYAVIIPIRVASAFDFSPDGGLVFILETVLKSEAQRARLPNLEQSDARCYIQQLYYVGWYSLSVWLHA